MSVSSSIYGLIKIEPPSTADNRLDPNDMDGNKLCMYRAMAKVNDGDFARYGKYVELLKPLRVLFDLPFDEDIWGLVLAWAGGYHYAGAVQGGAETKAWLEKNGQAGDKFFISMLAGSSGQSGHAVCAVIESAGGNKTKVVFHDNELPTVTDKLRDKFTTAFKVCLFKKVVSPTGKSHFGWRLAHLPEPLVNTLVRMRQEFNGKKVKIDQKPVTTLGEDDLLSRYAEHTQQYEHAKQMKRHTKPSLEIHNRTGGAQNLNTAEEREAYWKRRFSELEQSFYSKESMLNDLLRAWDKELAKA